MVPFPFMYVSTKKWPHFVQTKQQKLRQAIAPYSLPLQTAQKGQCKGNQDSSLSQIEIVSRAISSPFVPSPFFSLLPNGSLVLSKLLHGHVSRVRSIDVQSGRILSGSDDRSLKVRDSECVGTCLFLEHLHTYIPYFFIFSARDFLTFSCSL